MGKTKMKKDSGKKFNYIYDSFISSLKFIRTCKNYIYFTLLVFFIFALVGYFLPLPKSTYNLLIELIKNLVAQTSGFDTLELIGFIFWNNLKTSFIAMAFGILLGVVPLLIIVFNGFLVGFVAKFSVINSGEGVFSLWRLLPHGILELFAVFVSVGLGFKLGMTVFLSNPRKSLNTVIISSAKAFVFVVLPLLFLAAVIEGVLIYFLK